MIPTDFHFERPFWLLALIPAAMLLWQAVSRAGAGSGWRSAVDAHLLRHLSLPGEAGTHRWPFWLLGAGWLAATVAMAGPSWERVPQPTTKTIEPTVVALDMSVSMDAGDLTPSRLARARYKLQDVLERNAGGQVGLVIYSDEPFVASPLTDDGRVIGEMVPTLTSDIMPGRGSRPDRAIDQAVALLEQAGVPGGRILLFADSAGDDPGATRAAASRAAEGGRRVSVLGMGTEKGAPIPDGRGGFARTTDGEVFVARLPRADLESLAASGSGRFATVSASGTDLDVLLAEPLSLGSTDDGSSVLAAEVEIWKDAGVYLLVVPLLLAPFAFRRGWLAAVLLVVALSAPAGAEASVWDDLWQTRDQQAAAAFESGDVSGAAELFESADWKAAADYETGDFESAGAAFAALPGPDNRYNLGNALAKNGKLEDAIAAYDEVLDVEPEHEDARFNRDLVERLLKERERQQQEQQQAQQSQGDQGEEEPQERQSQGGEGQEEQEDQSQADSSGEQQGSEGSGSEQASAEDSDPHNGEPEAGEDRQETAAGEEQSPRDEQASQAGRSGSEEPGAPELADRNGPQHEEGPNEVGDRVDEALEQRESDEEGERGTQMAARESHEPMTEEEQAREQILRQVPDDPAGLLRAKIQRKYAEKRFAEQQRQLVRQGGTNRWW